ncbi:cytochrome P450 [Periconia macrospinosa]|uniref:Cytochrome P450 n=1 Tax=Periconia macrospinosa TaxID=97972 RepID=A0A2V1D2R3_9PLEO|nr:cytochrome P450 [Periconia macrospinosa]
MATIMLLCVFVLSFAYVHAVSLKKNISYPYAGIRFRLEPKFLLRLRFVFGAGSILQDGYSRFKYKPFKVARNDIDLLVLPAKYIDEIRQYTREQLSGIEALAFNVLGRFNRIDILNKSDLHVRVLRNYLTPNMGQVMPNAQDELTYSWQVDVPKCEDWEEVDIQHVLRWVIGRIYARTFIGYPACRNDDWIQTSLDYTRDVFGLTFLTHCFPKFLHPLVLLLAPASWRLGRHEKHAYKDGEPYTLLGGMLKDAKGLERDMEEIVLRQVISSLASIHTSVMTVTYCLLELCRHPEHIEPLREEAKECMEKEQDWARHSTERLPKVDSFICEVHRMHPPSMLIPQRRVREPFTLSNGENVPIGTQFGFPLGPISHDPQIFSDPEKFDGFRYYRKRVAEDLIGKSSKYMATTPSDEHLAFGHGVQACPGRFFAVNEIKLILVFFLMDYEFKQPERQMASPLHFPFEEYLVLNPTLKLMRRRKKHIY